MKIFLFDLAAKTHEKQDKKKKKRTTDGNFTRFGHLKLRKIQKELGDLVSKCHLATAASVK